MVKSLILDSLPGIPQRVLSRPHFTSSPGLTTRTVGAPILGLRRSMAQFVPMGRQARQVQNLLKLPETEKLHVVNGLAEMIKNQAPQKSTPDQDLKAASHAYFEHQKDIRDDSFEPREKSSVTEKNEADTAAALAMVQEPYVNKKVTKSAKSGKQSKAKKKNTHFKIVTKSKKAKK